MEAKVNLCRVKVHCLSFKRRLWELTFWVTAVQNWRLSNKYHIFAFLFYEFQRPRLDFSGGSRWGARGASPLLIFRLKWGPNFFWVRPPPRHSPLLHRPLDLTDCQAANQREGLSRSWKWYSFNFNSCWFFWKLVQKNDKRVWDLPSLHNTRYFFYVSQESEGN